MKKRTLLFTLIAGMCYLGFSSYDDGAAHGGAPNCTGSKASVTNCSSGGGCHGSASALATATIRVDSTGGVEVTKYVAGKTYTVTVTGGHATFTHFGFQYAAVSGTGSAQVQAGTFTTLPAQVRTSSLTGLNLIEHSAVISGTGTPATSFSKSFSWTAPATGVGNVTMYFTVNAVNGDGADNAADVSANTSKILTQYIPSAVSTIEKSISVTAYPNPVTNTLNLQLSNTLAGTYTINVCDLNGRNMASDNVTLNSAAQVTTINTANWNAGIYVVTIEKDGARQVTTIVKQ